MLIGLRAQAYLRVPIARSVLYVLGTVDTGTVIAHSEAAVKEHSRLH